jgi:urea transport system ATP-binding protein
VPWNPSPVSSAAGPFVPEQPPPLLETRGLSKRFGGVLAVDRLDLKVSGGTVHCVIGPNGAGKSTLFGLITNFQLVTAGEIFFEGRRITHLPPHQYARLGIARKFQVPALFPELTVAQNLLLGREGRRSWLQLARKRPSTEGDDEIREILETVRLGPRARARAGDLSHGEQQWLEIGVALMSGPRLLLLDEPTGGMSPAETEATSKLVLELRDRITMVVVEHDFSFIRRIADVVTVMHRGAKIAEGTSEEIASNATVRDVYLGRHVA